MKRLRNRRLPTLEQPESRELLAHVAVTNTNDSGPRSLGQAVADSYRFPGRGTITFDEDVIGRIAPPRGKLSIENTDQFPKH